MYHRLAEELIQSLSTGQPPFEGTGWSRGEAGILRCLCVNRKDQPVSMTSGELSRAVHLSTGRVATALKNLERKGFVIRRYDAADKRRVMVGATEAGFAAAREVHARILADTERLLRRLDARDAEELVRLMKLLIEQDAPACSH